MTAFVNIKRGDLHLAISAAFTRGRYVLMTGGDGQPREITIDLRERDDDLFEREPDFVTLDPATDDHGPAIPAQVSRIETPFGAVEGVVTNADGSPGPIVYEFALQETAAGALGFGLDKIVAPDAPDAAAFHAADWVHVYDRVTRERRTLKRPAPDAILTGLQDVAADLRARPGVEAALPPVGPLTSVEGLKPGDVLRVVEPFIDHDKGRIVDTPPAA